MENDKNKKPFTVFNFSETYTPPVNKWNEKLNIVEWGVNNTEYTQYVLDTFNNFGSSIHKNIINKKSKLISGKGFKEILDPALAAFVKKNKLDKEVKKATLDYELFNGFALEIIWDNGGNNITSIKHIPISNLRIGIESAELNFPHLWFSKDWAKYKKEGYEPEMIREFNPLVKQGKQIYWYCEYNPDHNQVYPIPGYSTSFNWIELEYQISVFHLNQAKNNYAPSFILNFSTGIPTVEEMDEFAKDFKKRYKGPKGETIIITYSDGVDGKPELIPITLNDSDERFIMLMDQIESHIVAGAEIPTSLVVLTPGKLGSSTERAELMIEFQQGYIQPRMNNIEDVLADITMAGGFKEELKLKTYLDSEISPVVQSQLDDINKKL